MYTVEISALRLNAFQLLEYRSIEVFNQHSTGIYRSQVVKHKQLSDDISNKLIVGYVHLRLQSIQHCICRFIVLWQLKCEVQKKSLTSHQVFWNTFKLIAQITHLPMAKISSFSTVHRWFILWVVLKRSHGTDKIRCAIHLLYCTIWSWASMFDMTPIA